MATEHAERARALVGTRFRPHGRSRDALDCVGVILATFGIDPLSVRRDYRLRGEDPFELDAALLNHFRRVPARELAPGDVMLMTVADGQLHLGVRTVRGFVHAHAGIGRVVETPGLPVWRLLGLYRKRYGAKRA
jgi:hypothetical protein